MADDMPSEPESVEELLRKFESILAELRAAAAAPPDPPESWTRRAFNPSPAFPRQDKFNLNLIEALSETLGALRASVAEQDARFERVAREMEETRALRDTLDSFRERSDRLEAESRSAAANMRGFQERTAALESELALAREHHARELIRAREEQAGELAQAREEQAGGLAQVREQQGGELAQVREQFAAEQRALADEMRERIQRLLDEQRALASEMRERIQGLLEEQRVCIRQLSLQASEQAVLTDRARRATELRLEELARRAGPPPA